MGGGPSQLEIAKAQEDKALEEKRKAQLEKAREDATKDRIHLKISEPRIEKDGTKVGKSSFKFEGTDDGAKFALDIARTNREAIEYEAQRQANEKN